MTRAEISAKYEAALTAYAVKRAACKPHHLPKKGDGFMDWTPEYRAVLDASSAVGHCLYLFEQDDRKNL